MKPNQIFLIGKYKTQASYFGQAELKEMIDAFINLDANYKSGKIDLNVGLETVLCGYCSK